MFFFKKKNKKFVLIFIHSFFSSFQITKLITSQNLNSVVSVGAYNDNYKNINYSLSTVFITNIFQTQMSTDDFKIILNKTEMSRENKFMKESNRLKDKFNTLHPINNTNTTNSGGKKIQQEVYDLTKDGISDDVRA